MKKFLEDSFITIKTRKVCGNVKVEVHKEIFAYGVSYRVYTYVDNTIVRAYGIFAFDDRALYSHYKMSRGITTEVNRTRVER